MKEIKPSIWRRILRRYQQGRLLDLVQARMRTLLRRCRYLVYDPASKSVSLHCPEYVEPGNNDRDIVGRIFASYKRMKRDQGQADARYLPSSQWEEHIEEAYSHLISGAREDDIGKFHFFLANFGTWRTYTGIESSTLIRDNMKSVLGRRYLANDIFYYHLRLWKWFYQDRKPISSLSYPMHGNQVGAKIDGVFVGVGSFFGEIYGSLLAGLIGNLRRPMVAELGAGYGRQAYFVLRDTRDFTYVDFDLPETLCLAAYFLMKTFPDRKCLLYGEDAYSPESHKNYDLIFMPSYEIGKLGGATVDLFINKYSLGEMKEETVRCFIDHISRATRGFFFHMNHEKYRNTYSGGAQGLLGHEYPLPANEFTLLFRYPCIADLLHDGFLDFSEDIFLYLYQKNRHAALS